MRRLNYLTLCLLTAIIVTSCSKEMSSEPNYRPTPGGGGGGGAASGLNGTWNFLFLNAKTKSTIDVTESGVLKRSVTESEYKSFDNKGTVTFDGAKMITTGLGYKIDTVAKLTYYEAGVLTLEMDWPMKYDFPATSSSANYKHVAADSIWVDGGSFLSSPTGTPLPSQPAGMKYRISNDTLIMITRSNFTSVQNIPGMGLQTVNGFIDGTTYFKKK